MDKPYAERIRLLHTLVRQEKGTLMLCERIKIRDSGHFLECLNKAFDANEEGVVIKQAGSKYQPGQREKGGWFKMKPDVSRSIIIRLSSTFFFYWKLFDFLFSVRKLGQWFWFAHNRRFLQRHTDCCWQLFAWCFEERQHRNWYSVLLRMQGSQWF